MSFGDDAVVDDVDGNLRARLDFSIMLRRGGSIRMRMENGHGFVVQGDVRNSTLIDLLEDSYNDFLTSKVNGKGLLAMTLIGAHPSILRGFHGGRPPDGLRFAPRGGEQQY